MAMKIERDDALREEITELENALIVPPPKDAKPSPVQKSGVFDENRVFVDASITKRPNGFFNSEPEYPEDTDIERLSGRYMFCGPIFGHFGHFLMDTMSRIWGLGELEGKIDGVLMTPKNNAGNLEHMLSVQKQILEGFGVRAPIKLITEPTCVEKLYVPYQGIGIGEGWETATPAFRDFMRKYRGQNIEPKGPEKVYVSRSALPRARASFLSEKLIEKHMEAAGYTVVHPQQLSKGDQIAMYRAAKYIVSADGSPMHMLAYCGREGVKVGVIARRSIHTHSIFASQLKAFLDADAHTINCLVANWLVNGRGRPNRLSWGELDIAALGAQLQEAGFLPEGTPPWPAADPAEVEAEMVEISKREDQVYLRVPVEE